MKKEKEYFLIKQWCPGRGQTSDNPSCLFYGSKIYDYPLTEKVKSYFCYTSYKKAENVMLRNYERSLYSCYEVVKIPAEMVEVYEG